MPPNDSVASFFGSRLCLKSRIPPTAETGSKIRKRVLSESILAADLRSFAQIEEKQ